MKKVLAFALATVLATACLASTSTNDPPATITDEYGAGLAHNGVVKNHNTDDVAAGSVDRYSVWTPPVANIVATAPTLTTFRDEIIAIARTNVSGRESTFYDPVNVVAGTNKSSPGSGTRSDMTADMGVWTQNDGATRAGPSHNENEIGRSEHGTEIHKT